MIDLFIIILAVFLVLLGIWRYIKGFKNSNPGCGGKCGSCPYSSGCGKSNGRSD